MPSAAIRGSPPPRRPAPTRRRWDRGHWTYPQLRPRRHCASATCQSTLARGRARPAAQPT
eukprot:4499800-Alexandrium_andersonii.AAC.1